jgi:hypothetical protein
MSEEQLEALMRWVAAEIDVRIELALGRDSLHEDINEIDCKNRLYHAFRIGDKPWPKN